MTFEDFAYAITVFSIFSFLIPLVARLVIRHQEKSIIWNLLLALFVVSGGVDLITFFSKVSRVQSASLINSYTIIQFFLLGFIYFELYLREHRSIFYAAVGVYVVFEILNSIFLQPFNTFQNFSWTLTGIIFIMFAIGWKLHIFVTTPVLKLNKYPYFWINTAILCYFSVNLFLFILTNYVFTNMTESLGRIFWSFHNFNNIVKNVLFAIGLYYFSPKFMVGNRFNPA